MWIPSSDVRMIDAGSSANISTRKWITQTPNRANLLTRRDLFTRSHDIRSYLPPLKSAWFTQTMHNKMNEVWPRSRQQATGIRLSARHSAARRAWYRRYLTWIKKWRRVLTTDKFCFYLWTNDGHCRVWQLLGRRYFAANFVEYHTSPILGVIV